MSREAVSIYPKEPFLYSLYLMRHGDAEPMRGGPDQLRALTQRGIDEVHKQATFLAESGAQIDRILHSPYKRAVQTAELMNAHLQVPMFASSTLVPNASPAKAAQLLAGFAEHLLVVCHLPIVADLAMLLMDEEIGFFTATLVRATRDDVYANDVKLDWIRHP